MRAVPDDSFTAAVKDLVERDDHGNAHELEEGNVELLEEVPPADRVQAEQKRQYLRRQAEQDENQNVGQKFRQRYFRQPFPMQVVGQKVKGKTDEIAVPDVNRAAEQFADSHFDRRH